MIEFKLENGESAFMQVEESGLQTQDRQDVTRSSQDHEEERIVQAPKRFDEAIKCVAPIGNLLLSSLKEINTPDEINLEFAISFNGKAGVVFSSIESEASFKVNITWKNKTTT